MKRLMFAALIIIALFFSVATPTKYVAGEPAKPVASLIIAPGIVEFFPEDKAIITQAITDCFTKVLRKKYDIISGDRYIEKLRKSGINDFASVERNDLIEAVDDESVKIITYISFPLPHYQGTMHPLVAGSSTYTVQVKIIDRISKKIIYTNSFQDYGSTPKRAMRKIIPKMEETLTSTMLQLLPPANENNPAESKEKNEL